MNFLNHAGNKHKREKTPTSGTALSIEPIPNSTHRHNSQSPPTPPTSPNSKQTPELDNEFDDTDATQPSHLQSGKRRTVSISRSGRYKTRTSSRTRILSEEVYSDTAVKQSSLSPANPVSPAGLVKPSGREKSPVRPYIILKSDTSVAFAIESTTL